MRLQGFMSHADTTLDFPEQGLVLVVGPNGGGKSSIMEAVAWACWGKMLRGSQPYTTGKECGVDLEMLCGQGEPLRVARHRSAAGKTMLAWGRGDAASWATYETTTKATEALSREVGEFNVWRRAHVFSSADAAHFTLATDKERKLLLEAILGLGRFAGALEACTLGLRGANDAEGRAWHTMTRMEAQAVAEEGLAKSARGDLRKIPSMPMVSESIPMLMGMVRANSERAEELRIAIENRDLTKAAHLRVLDQHKYALSEIQLQRQLLADVVCPTCQAEISDEAREALLIPLNLRENVATTSSADLGLQIKELDAARVKLSDEYKALQNAQIKLDGRIKQAQIDQATAPASLRSSLTARAALHEDNVAKLREGHAKATQEFDAAQTEIAELTACRAVLGLNGVRAQLLGRALDGINAVANAWLSSLGAGGLAKPLTINLATYREDPKAPHADALRIEVQGAGGGQGYEGCSAGERRRLDVALLFGLGSIAEGAAVGLPGDLWIDEALDSLDADGIAAVMAALADLAKSRKVICITHSSALVRSRQMDAAMHIAVENGHCAKR